MTDYKVIAENLKKINPPLEIPDGLTKDKWPYYLSYPYLNIYGNAPSSGSDEMFIDLGLPSGTLWMTKNIGATNLYDQGLYFQYGATVGYPLIDHDTNNPSQELIEHSTAASMPIPSSIYIEDYWDELYDYDEQRGVYLKPEHDGVYANTNGQACLPTSYEVYELLSSCTYDGDYYAGIREDGVELVNGDNGLTAPDGTYYYSDYDTSVEPWVSGWRDSNGIFHPQNYIFANQYEILTGPNGKKLYLPQSWAIYDGTSDAPDGSWVNLHISEPYHLNDQCWGNMEFTSHEIYRPWSCYNPITHGAFPMRGVKIQS